MGILYVLGALGAALIGFAITQSRRLPSPPGGIPILPGETDPTGEGAQTSSTAEPSGEHADRPGAHPPGERPEPDVPLAPPPGQKVAPPPPAVWSAALAAGCMRADIPLAYALRWGEIESGFNPGAVGNPTERGPDGYPREMGIAQLYNPDDLDVVSPPLTGAELRAYVIPGDWHEIFYKGKLVRGFSQQLLRPLTSAEIARQAESLVGLIARCDRRATSQLSAVGATGPGWSRSGRGYWALVKMRHGYPVLSSQGLPAIAKLLGRPPASWKEFTANLARAQPRYAGIVPRIVSNAEKTAAAIPEERGVV